VSEALEEINDTIRYTNWTAYKIQSGISDPLQAAADWEAIVATWAARDITVRGAYDLRGFSGAADLLLWLHAPEAHLIQEALHQFDASEMGGLTESTWSGMALHRPAEFNRRHVPGFMMGKEPAQWLCFYPFVRSYDWYLLEETERREMLVEHGKEGSKYPSIISSTVAAFGLGDYEWLLALESDVLHDIVDMMRDLRYTKARLHVREEVPFFTGRKMTTHEMGELFS
jgi:chlorite dismutase